MLDSLAKQFTEALENKAHKESFASLNRRDLSEKSDKDLAEWQSAHPPHSPQFLLAEHEWQRRLISEQVKASRFAAYMGILGAVVGAFITWLSSK